MANKNLFSTKRQARVAPANTRNKAGGRAYKLSDAETLCQYVVTSCFNDVYYASGREQLDEVKRICDNVEPILIAKAAVYGGENGMKDIPAYLCAVLAAKKETELLKQVFPRVIKSPKMLLNFVQVIRSGVTGRKSFGSAVKNLINDWITSRRGNRLFLASIGYKDPSFVDVLKMTHPRPASIEQNALFAYLLDKDYEVEALPPLTQEFLAFKADNTNPIPDMDYRSLTNCDLTDAHWKQIAKNMPWNTTRMNLNLLNRHGVFGDRKILDSVATKLRDPNQVRQNNVFPYQLLTTFQNVQDLPQKILLALQDAMEIATENVPVLGDRVAVCCDVSGSMSSPVTGRRGSVTTKTRCIDVAALMCASIARTNPETTVISFGTRARVMPGFNPRDSVMTNSQKLAQEGNWCGYGTEAANAMRVINSSGNKYDMIVFVGDCQSWIDSRMGRSSGRPFGTWGSETNGPTSLASEWATFQGRNKNAKLAEINLQPYGNSQLSTASDKSIMNIGGFSDSVFDVLNEFAHRDGAARFIDVINKIEL